LSKAKTNIYFTFRGVSNGQIGLVHGFGVIGPLNENEANIK
jgi:hypothetical protein